MAEGMDKAVPWYKTGWGRALLVALLLLSAGLIFFVLLTLQYWRQISRGQSSFPRNYSSLGFTAGGEVGQPSTMLNATEIAPTSSPFLGSWAAPVTIVEFVDFKCPNCKAAAPILQQVAAHFGSKVKLVVRQFPIESLHPGASLLSQVAYCAARQNRFWPLHTTLFENQDSLSDVLTVAQLRQVADRADVDSAALEACYQSAAARAAVQVDYIDGIRLGVRGTPTFFINGEKIEGVIPFAVWEKFLNQQSP